MVEHNPKDREAAQAVELGQVVGQPGWALDGQDSRLAGQRVSKSARQQVSELASQQVGMLAGGELLGALRCAHHGLDQGDAESALFKF